MSKRTTKICKYSIMNMFLYSFSLKGNTQTFVQASGVLTLHQFSSIPVMEHEDYRIKIFQN